MAGHRDRDGIMIKLARPIKYALHGTGPGIAAPTNKQEKKVLVVIHHSLSVRWKNQKLSSALCAESPYEKGKF